MGVEYGLRNSISGLPAENDALTLWSPYLVFLPPQTPPEIEVHHCFLFIPRVSFLFAGRLGAEDDSYVE